MEDHKGYYPMDSRIKTHLFRMQQNQFGKQKLLFILYMNRLLLLLCAIYIILYGIYVGYARKNNQECFKSDLANVNCLFLALPYGEYLLWSSYVSLYFFNSQTISEMGTYFRDHNNILLRLFTFCVVYGTASLILIVGSRHRMSQFLCDISISIVQRIPRSLYGLISISFFPLIPFIYLMNWLIDGNTENFNITNLFIHQGCDIQLFSMSQNSSPGTKTYQKYTSPQKRRRSLSDVPPFGRLDTPIPETCLFEQEMTDFTNQRFPYGQYD